MNQYNVNLMVKKDGNVEAEMYTIISKDPESAQKHVIDNLERAGWEILDKGEVKKV